MDPYLYNVADKLEETIDFPRKRGLVPFGDNTNRLFAALPLPEEVKAESLSSHTTTYEALMKKLDELNSRMIVVEWKHLRSIDSIMVIAGGEYKWNVLWTVLITNYIQRTESPQPSKGVTTELCTDTQSAEKLLSALDDYKNSSDGVKNWYKEMSEKIFRDSTSSKR